MVALEDKSISLASVEARRAEEWNMFYKKELDALEWAKEFMDKYERRIETKTR